MRPILKKTSWIEEPNELFALLKIDWKAVLYCESLGYNTVQNVPDHDRFDETRECATPIEFVLGERQVSTPEEKCIDFPEQKYISEAGKKGR